MDKRNAFDTENLSHLSREFAKVNADGIPLAQSFGMVDISLPGKKEFETPLYK